jgi:hypothetical protein
VTILCTIRPTRENSINPEQEANFRPVAISAAISPGFTVSFNGPGLFRSGIHFLKNRQKEQSFVYVP